MIRCRKIVKAKSAQCGPKRDYFKKSLVSVKNDYYYNHVISKNGEVLLKKDEIISELEASYFRRRAEHWFMVVTIMVLILALAAGLSLAMGNNPGITTELIIWGSALIWIFICAFGHAKEMSRQKREEVRIIDRLRREEKFRYSERPESARRRFMALGFALIVGGGLFYVLLNTFLMNGFGGRLAPEWTAEITVVIFAAVLAILGAFIRLFPLKQRYYNVRVSVLDNKPAMLKYRIRREQ